MDIQSLLHAGESLGERDAVHGDLRVSLAFIVIGFNGLGVRDDGIASLRTRACALLLMLVLALTKRGTIEIDVLCIALRIRD